MRVCLYLVLLEIFVYTNSTTGKRTNVDHKSFDSENENVSELENEEYSGDAEDSDNAPHFRARETKATDENKKKKRVFKAVRVQTITDFIQEAVNILNTYEDTAFEDFFRILDDEIRRYHYGHCKFSELTQNPDTRSFLAGTLELIRGKSVYFTKENINEIADMMKDKKYGDYVTELLDYINSLYIDSEQNFHRVIKELKHYRKTKTIKAHYNLVQVIRRGLRDIFFDHYTALDSNTRRELKMRIEKFWNQYKTDPASSTEVNNSQETKKVSASVTNRAKVFKKVLNEIKDPETYSKIDTQKKIKIKKDQSIETFSYDKPENETENGDASNDFEELNLYHATDEISSGQSFDSSSNSIKQSQERHKEYNTQRYMTLYTEKMSYEARTTKETKVIPITSNKITKKATAPRPPTTKSAQRHSSKVQSDERKFEILRSYHITPEFSDSDHDTESVRKIKQPVLKAGQDDKHRKQAKPDKTKISKSEVTKSSKSEVTKSSKSKVAKLTSKTGNVQVVAEYNAVLDVHLANSELLKSLGMFKAVPDNRYDTTSYETSVIQTKLVSTRPTTQFRGIQTEAAAKPKNPALTEPLLKDSKGKEPINLNRRISNTKLLTLLPEEVNYIRKTIKEEKRKLRHKTRRMDNDTIMTPVSNIPKNFNQYVIERLDVLEHDLKDFRSFCHNQTGKGVDSNATNKFNAKNNIENKRKDIEYNVKNEEDDKENNDRHSARSNIINKESTRNNTHSPKVTKKNGLYNINKITKNNLNDNKEVKKHKTVNRQTKVTVEDPDTKEYEPYGKTGAAKILRTISTPFYYANLKYQLDHINDGMDLHM